jgi:hypothetical protein
MMLFHFFREYSSFYLRFGNSWLSKHWLVSQNKGFPYLAWQALFFTESLKFSQFIRPAFLFLCPGTPAYPIGFLTGMLGLLDG